jgi:hypothetical protein
LLTGAERLRDQRPHRIRGFLSTLERLQHGDQLIEQRRDLAEGQAGFAADTGFRLPSHGRAIGSLNILIAP